MHEAQKNHGISRPSVPVGMFVKGRPFLLCGVNDPLNEIVGMMRDNHSYAAVVMQNGNFAGLLTEHNIIHSLAWELEGGGSLESLARAFNTIRAGDVMIGNPITVSADTSMEDALQAMTENKFCHVPVMENGNPVGILHITEAIQYMEEKDRQEIEERDMLLSHLMSHENYGCM